MKLELKVSKCTLNNKKNGYVLSLRTEGKKVEIFPGMFKETPGQLFLMSFKHPIPEGTPTSIDLDLFQIKEDKSIVKDRITGEDITLTNKWLWLK
jgi:hypothetical protein